jgi:hypothetical protein
MNVRCKSWGAEARFDDPDKESSRSICPTAAPFITGQKMMSTSFEEKLHCTIQNETNDNKRWS